LIKLASPGVPDIYQGNELFELDLVDPDNRHPVDYGLRRRLLAQMVEARALVATERAAWLRELLSGIEDGRCKLYVIWRTLDLRRRLRGLFQGGLYLPLRARGAAAEHVCAFARRSENHVAIIAVPRLCVHLMGDAEGLPLGPGVWGDTRIELPADLAGARLSNAFTGAACGPAVADGGLFLPLATLLQEFPVAMLYDAGVAP
jgi:(1->4)-alpha-D-glucan 1-alpha-D-glucosylmutase